MIKESWKKCRKQDGHILFGYGYISKCSNCGNIGQDIWIEIYQGEYMNGAVECKRCREYYPDYGEDQSKMMIYKVPIK